MSEQIIDKINKLLAKAESTTPAEAEALTAHAERLMIKYGIEEATLDREQSGRVGSGEEIVKKHVISKGTYKVVLHDLAQYVMNALNLRGVQNTGHDGNKHLWIIGFESDAARAVQLIESLKVQATVAMQAWWKENMKLYHWSTAFDKFKEREQFLSAFNLTVFERLVATRREVIDEVTQERGSGAELALRDRSQAVDDFMNNEFSNLKKHKPRKRSGGSMSAAVAGHRAGLTADVGQGKVGGDERGRLTR